MSDVTRILSAIEQGDPKASEELLPLVYGELRRLAARELRDEPSGNSVQPTALVHEAYIRLVGKQGEPRWNHRGHFYAAAAQAMRRIVVEQARRRKALKRGGDRERLPLDGEQMAAPPRRPDLLALDAALEQLAVEHPKVAQLVSLRFFAGLTMEQCAKAQGVSLRTAERNWTYAKAWLMEAIGDEG